MKRNYFGRSLIAGLFCSLALSTVSFEANAEEFNNIGGCGWGSKLFDGNKGIAPQILAVTTNGILGNQTFAITSGTSGCSQGGVVRSSWKNVMFLDANKAQFAKDIASGSGETAAAFGKLVGLAKEDEALFLSTTKANFSTIFASSDVSAAQIAASLKQVVSSTPGLTQYAANI